MGKRTKAREAQRFAAEQALAARLRSHGQAERRPAFITSYEDLPVEFRTRFEPYRKLALRRPETWQCRLRVRSPELRYLDFIRFAFAAYPVAAHLEAAWLVDGQASSLVDARASGLVDARASGPRDVPDFRLWYIIAGAGGSLYKEAACRFLTRLETHHFLSAPAEFTSSCAAAWYAVGRAATDDARAAARVARCALPVSVLGNVFWKEAVRFFALNQLTFEEANDFIACFAAEVRQEPTFSLAGRSLPALRRRLREWKDLESVGMTLGCKRWAGRAQPNAAYDLPDGRWLVCQIKDGMRLFREGARMRHCVASYANGCAVGYTSIWSLTRQRDGKLDPRLTLEVSGSGEIIECRGFANRPADPREIEIIARWAADFALKV
jgi:PcfJ-like protein